MDGVHDLGGRQGFGRIRYRAGAPAFHAAWERRVNALYGMAVRRGIFNMDEYRHAIERMEPRHYLAASYYERSLTGMATLCVEKGLVTPVELEQRARRISSRDTKRPWANEHCDLQDIQVRRSRSGAGGLRSRSRTHAGLHSGQDRNRRR